MKKILVGTDTSASADLAVEGRALARSSDAELLVLQVRAGEAIDAADPRKTADPDRYLARMRRALPGPEHPELVRGEATRPTGSSGSRRTSTSRRSCSATAGPTAGGGGFETASRTSSCAVRRARC